MASLTHGISSEQLEKNKKLVLDYIAEVWTKLDVTAVRKYKRPDFIDHLPGGKLTTSRDEFEVWLGNLFRNIKSPIESKMLHIIAEGDYVATHFRVKLPTPPSGELVDTTIIDLYRFQDGLIAEHWHHHS